MPKTDYRISQLSLAIAAAFALHGPAQAQVQNPAAAGPQAAAIGDADSNKLEAVTVTTRRREETLQDVPVAVTALSAATLELLNVKNLGDLQGNVPNLTVYAARGSNSTITTFIRGVGQADPLWGVDPGVGIYFDDVYMARPQGALLEVFDTQRIEVLRGPQGTLYGKNTIGGAVRYVSRPLGTKTEGSVSLTTGNYGAANVKAAVAGATEDGQWRLRVAGASLKHDGYGKNLTDGSGVSDQNTKATRITGGFYPTSIPLTVVLSADQAKDDSNMRGFMRMNISKFDPTKTPVLDSRYDLATAMPNQNYTHSDGQSLTATYGLSDALSLKYITAHRSSDTSTAIDFDGLVNKIADVRAAYADNSRSHELQLNFDGKNSAGVVGLYYFDGEAGGEVRNNFFNALFGTTSGKVYTQGKALYSDWSWHLTPVWGLSAGARYTEETKRAVVLNRSFSNDTFSTQTAVSANFDKSLTVQNTAPKVSLEYKLSDATKLYGSFSRGFKSGGYNVRANTTAVPDSGKPFDDETLDSFELGSKLLLDGGRLELNAAVFRNNYKNVQLSVFTSFTAPNGTTGFFGDFTNAGKATVQGGEVEFAWRPDAVWTLSGHVAALDAKYDEYMDRGVNVADQKKFTNSPKLQAAINLEYLLKTSSAGQVRMRLGASYRSKVYPTTDLSEAIAQDDFTLINAGAIWDLNKQWSVSFQASNLTDVAYRTDGYNIPALDVLSGYYGAPRTYTVDATYKF